MSRDETLARFAAEHHAVFTTAHAALCGFTEAQIVYRKESRRWLHQHLGAYYMAGAPPSWKGDLLAACWAGGFRAVASHRSAAALWNLAGGRRSMQEITCPRWRRARHAGLVVHETKAFDSVGRDGDRRHPGDDARAHAPRPRRGVSRV